MTVTLMTTVFRDAAHTRSQRASVQLADRPSQRRSGEDSRSAVRVGAKLTEARVAGGEGSGRLTFDGIASVTERAYEMWDFAGPYEEVVRVGAFTRTLARADLDVPLVIAHDQLRRIARTGNAASPLVLRELVEGEATGLSVLASGLDPADPDVDYVVRKLNAGLLDEMSFAFRIDSGRWSEDWAEYHINEVDIHRGDVAIVGYGANPHTSALMRTAPERVVRLHRARLDMARSAF